MPTVEMRCPVGPRRLLSKMLLTGDRPHVVDGLVEIACDDCKKSQRRKDFLVQRVVHRFDMAGQLVESEVMY